MSIFRLNLTRTYGTEDLKEDLRQLYKVVVKQPKVFMFTDADVADEVESNYFMGQHSGSQMT